MEDTMKDQNKTKAQLIAELKEMRQRVSELEQTEPEQVKAKAALHTEKEFIEGLNRLSFTLTGTNRVFEKKGFPLIPQKTQLQFYEGKNKACFGHRIS